MMSYRFRHPNVPEKLTKNYFELAAWQRANVVCGIDEVGRGCLAGPLVTGAVILPPYKTNPLLKDSKVMTEAERLKAYAWITKHCWYGVGIVHNRMVDARNIYQATLIAMKRALLHALPSCPYTPEAIVVDAMPLNVDDTSLKGIPLYYFPQGERKSSSIAAASIVAKVRRDALMVQLERVFPGYHLADHKGYSTAKHQEALRVQKPSLIHRISFLHSLKGSCDEGGQQSIC